MLIEPSSGEFLPSLVTVSPTPHFLYIVVPGRQLLNKVYRDLPHVCVVPFIVAQCPIRYVRFSEHGMCVAHPICTAL